MKHFVFPFAICLALVPAMAAAEMKLKTVPGVTPAAKHHLTLQRDKFAPQVTPFKWVGQDGQSFQDVVAKATADRQSVTVDNAPTGTFDPKAFTLPSAQFIKGIGFATEPSADN